MAPEIGHQLERHGRVLDASGAPVPHALVLIAASSIPMPEIALQSDDKGRFALRLPAGRFTLRAHGPGGAVGEAHVEGAPGSDEIAITIR